MWILGRLLKSESGHWKKAHLLLSTDAKLTPEQIIEVYGERWSIESMFNQLKLSWRRVPCDYIPKRSYPLFRTRQILNDWLTQNLEEA
ncbi:hypothetical protein [Thiolapillus sp.]|uniref:hypothetical protein n=1 Tax=Thiolapillus sp. TaxID=2017437 RepID=UPI003AF8BD9B